MSASGQVSHTHTFESTSGKFCAMSGIVSAGGSEFLSAPAVCDCLTSWRMSARVQRIVKWLSGS